VGIDSTDLTEVGATFGANSTSVATINSDFSVNVEPAQTASTDGESLLSMLLFRYPGSDTPKTVYAAAKGEEPATPFGFEIGLLIRADATGQLHVVSWFVGFVHQRESLVPKGVTCLSPSRGDSDIG
jgi:hypothetical protein